jgi:hypothetical protein
MTGLEVADVRQAHNLKKTSRRDSQLPRIIIEVYRQEDHNLKGVLFASLQWKPARPALPLKLFRCENFNGLTPRCADGAVPFLELNRRTARQAPVRYGNLRPISQVQGARA